MSRSIGTPAKGPEVRPRHCARLVKGLEDNGVELRHNPQLNAVVFKAFDEASAMARTNLSGPFAGVPMLLKDILGFKKAGRTDAPASCRRYLRLSI